MTSLRSSGSRRVESAVEPAISQNMTVKWRRSAACGGGSRPGGFSVARALPRTSRASPMPHWPQNLAVGSFSAPQAAQVGASGAPHLIQNLFPALVSAPQLGHLMGFLAMAQPNHTSTGSTSITIPWSDPSSERPARNGRGRLDARRAFPWRELDRRRARLLLLRLHSSPDLARLRPADVPCECPLIGVDRK